MIELLKRLVVAASPWRLAEAGILGMNRRNVDCILAGNPRSLFPRVDDKVATKYICHERGIPTPETYAVIDKYGQLEDLPMLLGEHESLVIKPANGAAGRGILLVDGREGENWRTSNGVLTLAELRYHLASILTGLYSLGGTPDSAIMEQRIVSDGLLASICAGGTPDIRVVLYRNIPVMAMVRLPTRASRGRANLHQGAVGTGVNLVTGKTTSAVCEGRAVEKHPDSLASVVGCQLPFWEDILTISIRLAIALELGYVGVDIAVDAGCGPVVMEANARPGLGIQVANCCGLQPRLRFIDALDSCPVGVSEIMALCPAISTL